MNDKYLCLNCWRISHVNDLIVKSHWYEPPGGRLGDLYPHTFWQKLWGLAPKDPYQLANQNGRTVKCKCGQAMPRCAKLSNKLSAIRIIGPKNSGKTLFLIRMIDSFNQEFKEMALRGICETSQHFEKVSSVLLKDKRWPEPTSLTGEAYAWRIMDAQSAQHPVLAFHDIGGKIWEQEQRPKNLTNYLALPGHLIFVLDGARMDGEQNNIDDLKILEHITENWNKQDYNNTKLALVITKADILWHQYPLLQEVCESLSKTVDKQDDLKQFLRQSGRNTLIIFAERYFRDTYIFATSSLGFCPKDNSEQLERQPEPLGTFLPLQWLLDIEEPV